jgi:hypothetical protein
MKNVTLVLVTLLITINCYSQIEKVNTCWTQRYARTNDSTLFINAGYKNIITTTQNGVTTKKTVYFPKKEGYYISNESFFLNKDYGFITTKHNLYIYDGSDTLKFVCDLVKEIKVLNDIYESKPTWFTEELKKYVINDKDYLMVAMNLNSDNFGIHFFDKNRGVISFSYWNENVQGNIVDGKGYIPNRYAITLYTEDGGKTWNESKVIMDLRVKKIYGENEKTVYVNIDFKHFHKAMSVFYQSDEKTLYAGDCQRNGYVTYDFGKTFTHVKKFTDWYIIR